MKPAITLVGISKSYGKHEALRGLTFSVMPGTIYGLIGPNGAGKTTSVCILSGLVAPSSGEAEIFGMKVEPNRPDLMSRIGFWSPQFAFFDYLTGAEVLLGCALMRGVPRQDAERRVQDLLALTDLERAAGQYLYQYSHGMRHKLGLACALVHAPEVLLLDEPFAGLDPQSVYRLACTLRQMVAAGGTILVTSHDLAVVERVCGRVGILHEGTLKREITPAGGAAASAASGGASRDLESVLWEVVGTPEIPELSWICDRGSAYGKGGPAR